MKLKTKKILAGLGLVVGVGLTVGEVIVRRYNDFPDIILRFADVISPWNLLLALGCGAFLFKAIFMAEKLRQQELEKNDERSQYMRDKAAYITFIVSMVILAILAFGFYVFGDNMIVSFILLGVIGVQRVCYWIAKRAIEKKM